MKITSNEMYKRNQIAEAVARCLPRRDNFHITIKRLLDLDSSEPVNPRSHAAASNCYAFSQPPERTGIDREFSGYDAFALLIAVRLFESGFKIPRVVSRMRELRRALEKTHINILAQPPDTLWDREPGISLSTAVSQGTLIKKLPKMKFLVLGTGRYASVTYKDADDQKLHMASNVCESIDRLNKYLEYQLSFGDIPIVIELVNSAHRLAYWLAQTEPIFRGR
jgi:hypothetical protein